MKKQIITLATLATLLAGCSNNEVYDVVNTSGNNLITFTNLNDKISRSANDSKDNYKVYAKLSTEGQTAWFIDDAVKEDNSIVSGNVYTWPTDVTVDFYAWAPASVTATATCPTISIDYTVPDAANQDFTIATPVVNRNNSTGKTVAFQFSHMLSKISVSAELETELAKAGYLLDYASAELKVLSTGATINPMSDTPDWTTLNSTAGTYTINKGESCMIMPQNSKDCSIQLKGVTITKGGATIFSGNLKVYTIKEDNIILNNKFAKNNHYNLKFTIDANAHDDGSTGGGGTGGDGELVFGNVIQFSAGIADWTKVTPDPGPIQP